MTSFSSFEGQVLFFCEFSAAVHMNTEFWFRSLCTSDALAGLGRGNLLNTRLWGPNTHILSKISSFSAMVGWVTALPLPHLSLQDSNVLPLLRQRRYRFDDRLPDEVY
jgi:hypothetical protein